jgi:multicomponent Na+:H+ antiporter subunit E
VKNALILGAVLFSGWLLWSGLTITLGADGSLHVDGLLLGCALLSVVAVVGLVRRMGQLDRETVPLRITLRASLYLPWLLWEIVKSNIDVARLILHPRLPISPRLIVVETRQRGDIARAVYANSITLTPGTVTIDTNGAEFTIHALTRAAAEGLQSGEMDRRVSALDIDP